MPGFTSVSRSSYLHQEKRTSPAGEDAANCSGVYGLRTRDPELEVILRILCARICDLRLHIVLVSTSARGLRAGTPSLAVHDTLLGLDR